jgi:hypothetical protein
VEHLPLAGNGLVQDVNGFLNQRSDLRVLVSVVASPGHILYVSSPGGASASSSTVTDPSSVPAR